MKFCILVLVKIKKSVQRTESVDIFVALKVTFALTTWLIGQEYLNCKHEYNLNQQLAKMYFQFMWKKNWYNWTKKMCIQTSRLKNQSWWLLSWGSNLCSSTFVETSFLQWWYLCDWSQTAKILYWSLYVWKKWIVYLELSTWCFWTRNVGRVLKTLINNLFEPNYNLLDFVDVCHSDSQSVLIIEIVQAMNIVIMKLNWLSAPKCFI